jgi:hypothetical protein
MDQGTSNENSKTTEPKQAATDSQRTRRAILTLHGNQPHAKHLESLRKKHQMSTNTGKKHPDFSSDSNQ